jgi:hypothetical protein
VSLFATKPLERILAESESGNALRRSLGSESVPFEERAKKTTQIGRDIGNRGR